MSAVKPLRWTFNAHANHWTARADAFHYRVEFRDSEWAERDGERALVPCSKWVAVVPKGGDGPLVEMTAATDEALKRKVQEYHRRRVLALLDPHAAVSLQGKEAA